MGFKELPENSAFSAIFFIRISSLFVFGYYLSRVTHLSLTTDSQYNTLACNISSLFDQVLRPVCERYLYNVISVILQPDVALYICHVTTIVYVIEYQKLIMEQFIINFNDIKLSDTAEVGTKFALLGDLANNLGHSVNVPVGFTITVAGFKYFMEYNKLREPLMRLMDNLTNDNLEETGMKARQMLMFAKLPPKLENDIIQAYKSTFNNPVQDVAVRSSASEYYSSGFNGYDTYLNIKGNIALTYAIKCCFASVYSDEALKYRHDHGMKHDIAIAVGIQQMIRSDIAGSGTILTNESQTGAEALFTIRSVWGLGYDKMETITPDEHKVARENDGRIIILKRSLGDKSRIRLYNEPAAGINTTVVKITPPELRVKFILTDEEIFDLARWAYMITSQNNRIDTIKWAKDGNSNKIFILGLESRSAKFSQ